MNESHFERLGLPRRFAIDLDELERAYLARSRTLHPDGHQLSSAADLQASLTLSAQLNEAYATLREPFRRAEYLLKLEDGPTAAEVKEMPQAFLMEVLELREAIEELTSDAERVTMETQLQQRLDDLMLEISKMFEQIATTDRTTLLRDIRRELNAVKYLRGLLADLNNGV